MRVLIAIPVFNEERHVAGVLAQVRRLGRDVLVIDDGSTDQTTSILDRTPGTSVIRHPENRGYGQSLIDAFRYADRHGYDWIVTLDADDQHEPALIPSFLQRAAEDDVDVISGSRYLVEFRESTNAPEDRRLINHRITRLINQKLGLSLTDAFCGFKAYRTAAVARLPLSIPGYAFPMQFWVQAVDQELRICELPVPRIYNDPTRHFGGLLDDPEARLRHYLSVFFRERERLRAARRACPELPCTPCAED